MKQRYNLIIVLSFLSIFFYSSIFPKTYLPVVMNYKSAQAKELWRDLGENQVPAALLRFVETTSPSQAFSNPYQDVFFQNDNIILCNNDCDEEQNLVPLREKGNFFVAVDTVSDKMFWEKDEARDKNGSIIRQCTVYYWINTFLKKLESLDFTTNEKLQVYVDREVNDPITNIRSENNAFFNSEDMTLSFLPAKNSFLTKILSKERLVSAGYDPSVIIHETGHFIFDQILGDRVLFNAEVDGGYNEAFADYMAMMTLESPMIGLVFGGSDPIRNAEKKVAYQSNMEVHDLGEVFGYVLWQLRKALGPNKELADRLVLAATDELMNYPYASAFTVAKVYLNTIDNVLPGDDDSINTLKTQVKALFASVGLFEKEASPDFSYFNSNQKETPNIVLSLTTEVPASVSKSYGLKRLTNVKIGLLDILVKEDSETIWLQLLYEDEYKSTPVWLYYDMMKKNILAAYDRNLSEATYDDPEIFEVVQYVAENSLQLFSFIGDFAQGYQDLSKNAGIGRLIQKSTKQKKLEAYVALNGDSVRANLYRSEVKPTVLAKVAGLIFGKNVKGMLNQIQALSIYTIDTNELGNLLPKYSEDELFIGYEVVYLSGIKERVMIVDISEDKSDPIS
ncbi:MAG: hypothetical protein ABIA04_00770 [Pseudomonadota bacterium]